MGDEGSHEGHASQGDEGSRHEAHEEEGRRRRGPNEGHEAPSRHEPQEGFEGRHEGYEDHEGHESACHEGGCHEGYEGHEEGYEVSTCFDNPLTRSRPPLDLTLAAPCGALFAFETEAHTRSGLSFRSALSCKAPNPADTNILDFIHARLAASQPSLLHS